MSSAHIASPPPRRRLYLLLAMAATLAAFGGVRWWNAVRAEQNLQTASLEDLQSLARQQPDNPRLFHFLGRRAAQAGDAALALDAFWRAVQLAPDQEDDWLGWAEAARETKGAQAADRILEAYLKRQPRSAPALLARARLYRDMEYHRSAYQYAKDAATANPKSTEAWGIMAEQARAFRDYATAETAARRALALAPKDWRCHLELGQALLAGRRTDAAVAAFRQAAELEPKRALTNLHLGIGLLSAAKNPSDFEKARASLIAAAHLQDQLGPHDRFRLLLALGESYQREARWKQALGPYLQAVKIEPGDETVHYALARVYRGLGDKVRSAYETRIHNDIAQYHASIRYLLLQIGGAPDDPSPRLKLARLYASRGNVIDAAKTYKGMIARKLATAVAERELSALESRPITVQR